MSEELHSVFAIVGGIAANFLAVPIDAFCHQIGIFPRFGQDMTDSLLLVALMYRSALAFGGGIVTAKLAPSAPMKHVTALGVVGVVMSTLGALAAWDLGHQWYPISLIAISLPMSIYGGEYYVRHSSKKIT
jgi:hypothetical protein